MVEPLKQSPIVITPQFRKNAIVLIKSHVELSNTNLKRLQFYTRIPSENMTGLAQSTSVKQDIAQE